MSVRSAQSSPEQRCQAQLNLVRVFLAVNMLEEADATLRSVARSLAEAGLSGKIIQESTILKGILHFQRGENRESAELWARLDSSLVGRGHAETLKSRAVLGLDPAPAPRLSTP